MKAPNFEILLYQPRFLLLGETRALSWRVYRNTATLPSAEDSTWRSVASTLEAHSVLQCVLVAISSA